MTNDLLLNEPIPSQSRFNSQRQNIGRINNNGVELKLPHLISNEMISHGKQISTSLSTEIHSVSSFR